MRVSEEVACFTPLVRQLACVHTAQAALVGGGWQLVCSAVVKVCF